MNNLLQRRGCRICQPQCCPIPSCLRRRWFHQAAISWFIVYHPASQCHAMEFPSYAPLLRRGFHNTANRTKNIWTEGISSRKNKEQDSLPVLRALEHLVSRLGEFSHNLQVPASNPALMDSFFEASLFPAQPSSDFAEQEMSVEELARVFCQGYANLAPLQLGTIATAAASSLPSEKQGRDGFFKKIGDCPRGAILFFLAEKCGPPGFQNGKNAMFALQQVVHNLDSTVFKELQKLWTPLYHELFQCLLEQNSQHGVSLLVEMRGDLLRLLRTIPNQGHESTVGALKELERHLRRQLSVWFSPGLLEVRRITYDTTSAGIIEKIALKEAVHPMKSLDDLRQRLGPNRRVFALFHPLLPGEPLVILHVHLETKPSQVPSSMQHVLSEDEGDPRNLAPLVATFYSISNTQSGLTGGLGLGEFVIKSAVKVLRKEFPNSIETFVTLSPLPTFRKWMEGIVPQEGEQIDDEEWTENLKARGDLDSGTIDSLIAARSSLEQLVRAKKFEEIEQQLGDLGPLMAQLAARYLVVAKNDRSGKPLDAVTGFHVGNGAEVYRVNPGADFSRKGLLRSFGVMVNYRYPLEELARNKARFESSQYSHIPVSPQVEALLKASKK